MGKGGNPVDEDVPTALCVAPRSRHFFVMPRKASSSADFVASSEPTGIMKKQNSVVGASRAATESLVRFACTVCLVGEGSLIRFIFFFLKRGVYSRN